MYKFCFHNFSCILKVEFWIIVKRILSQSLLKQNLWLIMTAQGAVTSLGFESNFRNFFLLMVYVLKAEGMTATSLFLFLFPLLSPSYFWSVYSHAEIIVALQTLWLYCSSELAPNPSTLFLFSHLTSPLQFVFHLLIPVWLTVGIFWTPLLLKCLWFPM